MFSLSVRCTYVVEEKSVRNRWILHELLPSSARLDQSWLPDLVDACGQFGGCDR